MSSETSHSRYMLEYDIIRVLAIICMILIHVTQELDALQVQTTGGNPGECYCGSLPAAFFMIPMGVFIAMSSRNTPKRMFARGATLFLMGYALNFVRDFVPYTLFGMQGEKLILLLLCVDILQFAGLAFVSFAIMKGLRLKNWHMAAVALAFLLISSVAVWYINISDPTIKQIYGLFIYCGGQYDTFPLMSWLIYPVVGYIIGTHLVRAEDRGKVYTNLMILGVASFAAAIIAIFLFNVDLWEFIMDKTGRFSHTILGFVAIFGLVAVSVTVLYHIQKKITSDRVRSVIRYIGKNLTPIYVMQWIIIGWFIVLVWYFEFQLPIWSWFLVAFAVLVACLCLIVPYNRLKKQFADSVL